VISEEKGRLSNPVQRRLSEATIDDLVSAYLEGSSIDSLAAQSGVNRTTIIVHLDRRGIQRRKVVRKMTDRIVRCAATRYSKGESLKVVAAQFGVDARTLSREFRRAGVPIRPRRGWPPSI
jgi:transposase-like protein